MTGTVEDVNMSVATTLSRYTWVVAEDIVEDIALWNTVVGREIQCLQHLAGNTADVSIGIGNKRMIDARAERRGCLVDEIYLPKMGVPLTVGQWYCLS